MRSPLLPAALPIIVLAACPKDERPPAPPRSTSLPRILVKARDKLLLTFFSAKGFETVSKLEDVPEASRGWVRVVDLRVKPAQRQDHELVYVADLRKARADGTYPYAVMPRRAFELSAAQGIGGATEPPASRPATTDQVILYATRWCPACRTARAHLKKEGIPFVEKDIEADPRAAAELLRKAKAAGISPSGVPVLDVRGTLMQGFDPGRLAQLLRNRREGRNDPSK